MRCAVSECGDYFQGVTMKITVPDISGDDTRPPGICWIQGPGMWRCTKVEGHAGKHSWEK